MDLSLLPDGGMRWLDASGPKSTIVLSTRIRLAREYETAVVVVTHNRQLAGRADRVLLLEDGRLTMVNSVDAIP